MTAPRAKLRRGGPPVLDPDGHPAEGPVLVLRPVRVRVVAWVCAVGVVLGFAGPAAVLLRSNDGVFFRPADQVAVLMLGVLIAAGILLLARPRVRADARGVEVRTVGSPRYLPWEAVRAVSFPDGAWWARLDVAYDEYVPVLAVQAVDGQRAVADIRRLRALHAAAHTAAAPGPAHAPRDTGPDAAGSTGVGSTGVGPTDVGPDRP